jgi:hypothetical protein
LLSLEVAWRANWNACSNTTSYADHPSRNAVRERCDLQANAACKRNVLKQCHCVKIVEHSLVIQSTHCNSLLVFRVVPLHRYFCLQTLHHACCSFCSFFQRSRCPLSGFCSAPGKRTQLQNRARTQLSVLPWCCCPSAGMLQRKYVQFLVSSCQPASQPAATTPCYCRTCPKSALAVLQLATQTE